MPTPVIARAVEAITHALDTDTDTADKDREAPKVTGAKITPMVPNTPKTPLTTPRAPEAIFF